MKLSKEKQQQLIGVVIGAVVLVVALWFLVISSQKAGLQKIAQEIAKANGTVSEAEKTISLEDTKLKILTERTNKLSELEETMMPTNNVYSTFRTTLNRFKAPFASQVDITDVSKERPGQLGMLANFPYGTASFAVRGTATFHNFGRFLAAFENNYAFYRIKQFSLALPSALDAAKEPEALAFELDIVTLIKPNP